LPFRKIVFSCSNARAVARLCGGTALNGSDMRRQGCFI